MKTFEEVILDIFHYLMTFYRQKNESFNGENNAQINQ